jgi:uncharacterized protein (UPF0333 family)
MKNNKGQTFLEFILVFIILFAASAGLYALYKSSLENKFQRAAGQSGIGIAASMSPGGYVK